MTKPAVNGGWAGGLSRKMNKLYGTANVNGTQETAESINTNNWPILTYMQNRMHNSGCGRCEMKQPQLITWNTSGKYIYFLCF